MFKPADLFDLSQTEHAAVFEGCDFAWDALKKIRNYLRANLRPMLHNRCEGDAWIAPDVFIGEGTLVEDGAMIKGPTIIGRNCEIRHGAYVRGDVIIGDSCVVGNACELKNVVLFNGCAVPHFNYVGDSILGHKAHLGAGVKISNVKLDHTNIMMEVNGQPFDTGLLKFGALLGDFAEVGCNAVLNPGSVLGRNSAIYPNVNWRGVLPNNMLAKNKAAVDIVMKRARES